MTGALQKNLFTKRWRKLPQRQQEVNDLHIPLVAILRWAIKPTVLFRHVPNGERRDIRTAQKLKAMGVLPGAADLEFHWCEYGAADRPYRRVLHLELKVGNREPSEAQNAYRLAMLLLGDEYLVVRSIDDAVKVLGKRGLLRSDVEVCGRRWGTALPD